MWEFLGSLLVLTVSFSAGFALIYWLNVKQSQPPHVCRVCNKKFTGRHALDKAEDCEADHIHEANDR